MSRMRIFGEHAPLACSERAEATNSSLAHRFFGNARFHQREAEHRTRNAWAPRRRRRSRLHRFVFYLVALTVAVVRVRAAAAKEALLEKRFDSMVKPFVQEY